MLRVLNKSQGQHTNALQSQAKDELAEKLEKEAKAPSGLFSESQLEDICKFLLLNNWPDEVLCAIMEKENIVNELAYALHNDDVLADFTEARLQQLVLKYAV